MKPSVDEVEAMCERLQGAAMVAGHMGHDASAQLYRDSAAMLRSLSVDATQPLTNLVTDAIDGYKAGLAGEPIGFVSAAFDCGWYSGDSERAQPQAEPVKCNVCGWLGGKHSMVCYYSMPRAQPQAEPE